MSIHSDWRTPSLWNQTTLGVSWISCFSHQKILWVSPWGLDSSSEHIFDFDTFKKTKNETGFPIGLTLVFSGYSKVWFLNRELLKTASKGVDQDRSRGQTVIRKESLSFLPVLALFFRFITQSWRCLTPWRCEWQWQWSVQRADEHGEFHIGLSWQFKYV